MNESPGLLIALSAGGNDAELAEVGIGMEHVDELMVRIARKLLMLGHQLSFGGALGDVDKPLTRSMIDAAVGWLDEASARAADVTRPETWPLLNYSAWPVHNYVSAQERAKLVGICNFVNVDPTGVSTDILDDGFPDWPTKPKSRMLFADALTQMRDRSASESELRIVWAGAVIGAKGWMAGILEEVFASLRHHKPVLVFGGFGGCAGLLASYLIDPQAPWPAELAVAASADGPRDILLAPDQLSQLQQRFQEGMQAISDFRDQIHSSPTCLGIPSDLLKDALTVNSTRNAISLAAKAAAERWHDLVESRVESGLND